MAITKLIKEIGYYLISIICIYFTQKYTHQKRQVDWPIYFWLLFQVTVVKRQRWPHCLERWSRARWSQPRCRGNCARWPQRWRPCAERRCSRGAAPTWRRQGRCCNWCPAWRPGPRPSCNCICSSGGGGRRWSWPTTRTGATCKPASCRWPSGQRASKFGTKSKSAAYLGHCSNNRILKVWKFSTVYLYARSPRSLKIIKNCLGFSPN